MTQALLNLTSNAVKFTNHGFVRIHVSATEHDDQQMTLKFSVEDSGIGLSPDMCERVFERFVQGENQTSLQSSGTGLGLPICRQLAQLMNGNAGVTSTLGKGSTFWLTAVVKRNVEPSLMHATETTTPQDTHKQMAGLRILIVEDDDAVRDAMYRLLKTNGMHVDFVGTGHAALEKLNDQTYELVLADVRMPEMGGLELTQLLRQSNQAHIKIIGVSAGVLGNDRQACLDAGMNDHIAKPFKVNDLLDTIHRHAF